jgi:hypothetical protein
MYNSFDAVWEERDSIGLDSSARASLILSSKSGQHGRIRTASNDLKRDLHKSLHNQASYHHALSMSSRR